MAVLALTSDLVLRSQLAGAATRVGAQVDIVASLDELLTRGRATQPSLVILDLNHAELTPAEIVPRIREHVGGATILAFGPHVHKERLAAATAAGCDRVLSRGQFHAGMESILESLGLG
jgi:DNA-binding response OmpR family regulator